MGTCTGGAAYGIQRLLDADARFFRAGLTCYYVETNANIDDELYAQMGMTYVPTSASGMSMAGTSKSLVDPPVAVTAMTLKQLSDAANVGSDLRMGAKIFTFSNTWVQNIMQGKFTNGTFRNYTNGRQVFNAPQVLGFLYDGLLYNFDSFLHQDAYGAPLIWSIICNANEIK